MKNYFYHITNSEWNNWQWQLKNRINSVSELKKIIHLSPEEIEGIKSLKNHNLPMLLTPYFASLLSQNDTECPLRKQIIPNIKELAFTTWELNDPLGEEDDSPIPFLVHRYPDRALLLATPECAAYCRYCTRRRLDRREFHQHTPSPNDFENIYTYLSQNKQIRDVIISGGDPLLLPTTKLEDIIKNIKKIPHIDIIRIGTRVPTMLPQRIDDELISMLKKYQPLYMSIHFSHPQEITQVVKEKCNMLADAGISLGSQTVLLKDINDSPQILKTLFHELLKLRIKPYYLYQCDLVLGIEHFRTPIDTGINILENLRGHTSGYAIPTFVIDAPHGGGKVPVSPNYIIAKSSQEIIFKNYQSRIFQYPDVEKKSVIPTIHY